MHDECGGRELATPCTYGDPMHQGAGTAMWVPPVVSFVNEALP